MQSEIWNLSMASPTARLPLQLINFFSTRVARKQSLALIVVLSTEGSSYSKAGHPLLIDDAGEFQGILSGGCLEGDLAERSLEAMRRASPVLVEYDLRGDDELFGLGVGCEGVMQVLIQPLPRENGYEPLSEILNILDDQESADIDVTCEFGDSQFRWVRPCSLLVLGAGPDVKPLLEMCSSLGWAATANDHRPAWAERLRNIAAVKVHCVPAQELQGTIDFARFDAAIVMSHNLAADRAYLEQLAQAQVAFVGLLGPPHRRNRLLDELGDAAAALSDRLHAPVGRQIGGRGPAAIALEIVTELQEHFCAIDQELSSASRSPGVSISIEAGSKQTASTD